jgi:uncharacterized delta-60 repeat protein
MMKRMLLIAAISALIGVTPAAAQQSFLHQNDWTPRSPLRREVPFLQRQHAQKNFRNNPFLLRQAGPFQFWYDSHGATGERQMLPPGINTWDDIYRYSFPPFSANSGASSHLNLVKKADGNLRIGWVANYASQLAPSWDEAYAVRVDAAGNVYVTGSINKLPYGTDGLTIKYNAAGLKLWEAQYNSLSDGDDVTTEIAVDAAGNVYVAGLSAGAKTGWDYLVVKYNSAGDEQWANRYDGAGHDDDFLSALAIDAVGNVYVTGGSAIIKYNVSGAEQWAVRYDSVDDGVAGASDLVVDRAGNVYITGTSDESLIGSFDYVIVKYNSAGVKQWISRYNNNSKPGKNDRATAIAVDSSGNVYVTGWSLTAEDDFTDYATVKYNGAGVQQWVARYNGPANDSEFAEALAVDKAGNVYVTGMSWGRGTSGDYATIKYNAAGREEWVDRYNGPFSEYDAATKIVLDEAGNVYVTGRSRSAGSIWYAQDDYATIKYSPNGVRQWVAHYNAPANGYDQVGDLAIDASGNVYVTGRSEAAHNDYDFATIKYNAAGNQVWLNRENRAGTSMDYARAFAIDNIGNVYVTGTSEDKNSATDFATVKFNANGVQQWAARYNGPGNFLDYVAAVKVDQAGNVYVTGESDGVDTRRDFATIKYNSAGVQQWVARYNAPGNLPDTPVALEVDRLGNVYVAGNAFYTNDGTNTDYTTIKYDANGRELWIARYNGPSNSLEVLTGLAVDAVGNVYVTGSSPIREHDCVTIKYSSAGVEQWVARYHHADGFSGTAQAIAVDKSGNIFITGNISNRLQHDVVTIKYRANGEPQWVATYRGSNDAFDRVAALAVDRTGNVYVTGSSSGIGQVSQYITIKYNSQGVEQWISRYTRSGYVEDSDLGLDDSGNVYVVVNSDRGQAAIKYNAAGVEQWVAEQDGVHAKNIALDHSGNLYLMGSTSGYLWSIFTITKYIQNEQSFSAIPNAYALGQNYPNPFYYATSIDYALPVSGHVTVKVYNLAGQEVATVVDAEQAAGRHEVDWGSENLPAGVYLYRLQVNGFKQTNKFIVLK